MKNNNFFKVVSLLCCLIFILPSCAKTRKYSETYLDYFDTVTSFTVYGVTKKEAEYAIQALEGELERYHRRFDIYNEYDGIANLKSVNDSAGISPVCVDGELIELLEYGVSVHSITSGYVNIAMGSVLKLWHNCRKEANTSPESAKIPDEAALREAALHTDIKNININADKGEVYISDKQTAIDVGAIAKGYVAQRIFETLKALGYKNFVLSIGGNVIAAGYKEKDLPWQVGVDNPSDTSKTLCSLSLTDKSLVTSGSYQRYYTVDGNRYHHIIDPFTLVPKNDFLSVSVISEDSALADAMSTALFNMPYDMGAELVLKTDGLEAMWVTRDGEILYSENFKSYIITER
ncbi:MAG: FAD:protein FMN transferase [Clostridia bacterium]|nr:FAD:protein FMN transferase [Clostridia bacterium]